MRLEMVEKLNQWRRVGKKKAGRVLDGRTWDEMPEI
jgi:protein gp37